MPVVRLTLVGEAEVLGYWSDGTATVELTTTLLNTGDLRHTEPQEVVVACQAPASCYESVTLTLADGFGPAHGSFILRVPIGELVADITYGGQQPRRMVVDVPERILGITRDLWDCYAHRLPREIELYGEFFAGCGGWGERWVVKWANDVPVKVWATGEQMHLEILDEVLAELSPILNLQFEKVETAEDADFTAYVGVDPANAKALGIDVGDRLLHAWGFASPTEVDRGEVLRGQMIIWDVGSDDYNDLKSVTLHEALHALVPIRHSTRPASIVGASGLSRLSPRDIALFRFHANSLVRPGMRMSHVEQLIVFSDELLDEPAPGPTDAISLLWDAYVGLVEADSATFLLSGSNRGNGCSYSFGRRRPLVWSIEEFRPFKDDPALVHLQVNQDLFRVQRTSDGRTYWRQVDGEWESVDTSVVADATDWWWWSGKLLRTMRSVLMEADPADIAVQTKPDGDYVLSVVLDNSYTSMWDWKTAVSLRFALTLDVASHQVKGYEWERTGKVHPRRCITYKEVATDGLVGETRHR